MTSKKIKCPKCGGIIEVANPQNASVLLITCPNLECCAKLRLAFETGETQLGLPKRKENYGKLLYHGTPFLLKKGVNTIGRKSHHGNADILIETSDRSMSRLHAEIEVKEFPSGRIKVIVKDIRDREKSEVKPLKINGKSLTPIDQIVLADGDNITMGDTIIRFVQNM